jgi:MFS family permease
VGTFLWSASWVGTIEAREPRPERATGSSLLGEVREGVAFIARDPVLRQVAGATGTANLWSSAAQGMLIVLLARTLGLSAGVIGLLMAAGAAGGLLGALTARPLAGLIGEGPVTWLSLGVASPLALVQPFLHRNWTLGLFVVAQIGFSAGVVIYNVTQVSFRQRLCPEHLLGRMNASMRFLVWGTMPVGGLLGGALGSAVGVRATLLVAAIGQSLAFLWVFFSPLRSLREVTTSPDPGPAVTAPLVSHGLDQAGGPHVGPVRLDVVQALLPGRRAMHSAPARRHPGEYRPQRMLALVVDYHEELAVPLERVYHRSSFPGRPASPAQSS